MPTKPRPSNSRERANALARETLKPREARFVGEYLKCLDGQKAATDAGYSERTARKIAYELLQRPAVKAAVQAGMHALAKRAGIEQADVLAALERIAKDAEAASKFEPALRGWELIGKHIGMFRDKVEHTGPGGGPIQFQRIERTVVDPK